MLHKNTTKKFPILFLVILLCIHIFYPAKIFASEQSAYAYIFEGQEYLFGSQLEEEEQLIYLEILKNLSEPGEEAFTIPIEDMNQRDNQLLSSSINNAIAALMKDFPELQWLKLGGGSNTTYYEVFYQNKVATKIVFYPVLSDEYINLNDYKKEQKELEAIVKDLIHSIPENYNTRYSRLKYIHDYLVKMIAYDSTQSKEGIYSAAGAFINQLSVCEGYSKAFKMVCEYLGIPNQLVISKTHMWNQIQMENGKWYLVDVTFDDPIMNGTSNYKSGKNLSYDYFLKGSSKIKNDKTHTATGAFDNSGFVFSYQTLEEENYNTKAAEKEAITIYEESFLERFLKGVTAPQFGVSKKVIYNGKTYTQEILGLSEEAKISYSSNDKSVATVSADGKIKGVGTGTCKITTKVTQEGETFTHTLQLTVKEPKLVWGKYKEEVKLGTNFQYKAWRYGIKQNVTWSVSDTSIAIIYKGGTLKPLKTGKVTVTATAGGKSIHMTVKITK